MLRAAGQLLRPLVRLLMQGGVTFPALAELLRRLYVEIAVTDLLTGRGASTDSRVSLLTGIHRKEIRRLRAARCGLEAAPVSLGVASQVVARWLGSPLFAGPDGAPLVLPRATAAAAEPSFDGLVAAVTTDIPPAPCWTSC